MDDGILLTDRIYTSVLHSGENRLRLATLVFYQGIHRPVCLEEAG
jgi:hypothetical protein